MLEEIIRSIDNGELNSDRLSVFFKEYLAGNISDSQVIELLQKFKDIEDINLIKAFIEAEVKTGIQLNWDKSLRPIVDKHSTGGVGDKVSLIVVPWIASVGLKVAKLSGRSLGHTGGTIDKLESINGVSTNVDSKTFMEIVKKVGCAIAEPGSDICPVEPKLYELRDKHGLVPFLPLITASILSKKIASNADIIVFDVKTGSGAFMKDFSEALKLANLLVSTAKLFGKKASALITSMDNPLGHAVGNSLEVLEAIEFFEGRDIPGLNEVVYTISMLALTLAGFDEEEAFIQLEATRRSGKALKYFLRMIEAFGGPKDLLELKKKLPRANVVGVLTSTDARGYVHRIDPLAVSRAVNAASGGTRRPETGIILRVSPGDQVNYDDELCEIHAVDYESLDKAADIMEKAFIINESKSEPPKYLLKTIFE